MRMAIVTWGWLTWVTSHAMRYHEVASVTWCYIPVHEVTWSLMRLAKVLGGSLEVGLLVNKWMKKYPFPVNIFSYFLSDRDQWKFHCMNEIRNTDDFVHFTPWANMISWDWALQDCPGLSAAVLPSVQDWALQYCQELSAFFRHDLVV